jgi:hypothetical protein
VDEISLTLPADEAFHRVAHLVLGGLAVRLQLTYDKLEDLELALDTLLERYGEDGDVTVRVRVGDGEVRTAVGPFAADVVHELEHQGSDELDLSRILQAVSDRVEVNDGWIELTKRIDVER